LHEKAVYNRSNFLLCSRLELSKLVVSEWSVMKHDKTTAFISMG